MAKKDGQIYLCGECGYENGRWFGKCPSCGGWNTMAEYTPPRLVDSNIGNVKIGIEGCGPKRLGDIETTETKRISTGISELNRVLGGGIVPDMAVLLGGDPGIGKSTLLLQVAGTLSKDSRVLYVSGEESQTQVKLRAMRLKVSDEILFLSETRVEMILDSADAVKPNVLIIDSIQTLSTNSNQSTAGSSSQIREVTQMLLNYSKSNGICLFIVGHVTKEGALAGPKMLEHMVDTVLYFEGDRHDSYRILRAEKNRFGSTNEIGVFKMQDKGIFEVTDPSSIFLSRSGLAGCSVTAAMEGTRPILAEVQALICKASFSNPGRMCTGFDKGRLMMILAVLEKKAGLAFYDKDVYLNTVGGIKITDPSNDLAVALAIASVYFDRVLPRNVAILGEIGLTGELRSVSRADARINECVRLGYNRIILPKSSDKQAGVSSEVSPVFASTVNEAINILGMK